MCVRLIHTTHNNMSRGATLAEPLLASSAGEDTIPAPGASDDAGGDFVPPEVPLDPVPPLDSADSPLKPSPARAVRGRGAGSITRSMESQWKHNDEQVDRASDWGSSARATQAE
eukprot:Hpha_TRINITY_DN15995_c0_g1::TRINITY_DN15995_c0_g1_i18::g.73866::m.73866